MSDKTIPLLLTSCIIVSAKYTALSETELRLTETIKSLEKWTTTPDIGKIVICDGSGFDITPYVHHLKDKGIDLEVLTFKNDAAGVLIKGKGYGEGQIVNYALSHSRILSNSTAFAKCTSKLWVSNYSSCIAGFNGRFSFDFNGWLTPKFIDTRFYIAALDQYKKLLSDAHIQVDDDAGYYLEHAFKDALSGVKSLDYAMVPTPRIQGVSGSTAKSYQTSSFKSLLRDARSICVKNFTL